MVNSFWEADRGPFEIFVLWLLSETETAIFTRGGLIVDTVVCVSLVLPVLTVGVAGCVGMESADTF